MGLWKERGEETERLLFFSLLSSPPLSSSIQRVKSDRNGTDSSALEDEDGAENGDTCQNYEHNFSNQALIARSEGGHEGKTLCSHGNRRNLYVVPHVRTTLARSQSLVCDERISNFPDKAAFHQKSTGTDVDKVVTAISNGFNSCLVGHLSLISNGIIGFVFPASSQPETRCISRCSTYTFSA